MQTMQAIQVIPLRLCSIWWDRSVPLYINGDLRSEVVSVMVPRSASSAM